MTPLLKPVTRMGSVPCYGRPLVVTIYPGDIIGVRQARTRTRWPLVLALIVVLIGLAGGVTACGGGDADDDERASIGPVDCKLHPEQCQ